MGGTNRALRHGNKRSLCDTLGDRRGSMRGVLHGEAPIHVKDVPRNVRRGGRREKADGLGNVFGRSGSVQRNSLQHRVAGIVS